MDERPDGGTLRLLRDIVEEVGTNEAVAAGGTIFELTIEIVPNPGFVSREPEPRVLRHLLDRLRHLDMASSDTRLERVFPIIERVGVQAGWSEGLEAAKTAYAEAQNVTDIRVEDPDSGPVSREEDRKWIRPREAFGLWAYGGVIHSDWRKEQRWARLGSLAQGPVREMAHSYTMMLLDQAEFMARLLRHGLSQDPEALR
jgi:hypothetical protein